MIQVTEGERDTLARSLRPGETLRWTARALPRLRRPGPMGLLLLGFGLVFLLCGVSWFTSCADFPLTVEGWARLQGLDLAFALFSLLFALLPACLAVAAGLTLSLFACGVGSGRDCPLYALSEQRAFILSPVLPDPFPVRFWNLWRRGAGGYTLETHPLTPDISYQLAEAEGRGTLVFEGGAEKLFEPDAFHFHDLPDARAAESALLALTRSGEPGPLPEAAGGTPEERAWVQGTLCRGEQVRWVTRPIPTFFPLGEGRQFAFFALFTAFVLGMGAVAHTQAEVVALFGDAIIGFLALCGIAGLLYPLWRRHQLARTLYLVTTRRALILAPALGGGLSCLAFPLSDALVTRRHPRPDGSGDLDFSTRVMRKGQPRERKGGFYNLPDFEAAEMALDKK